MEERLGQIQSMETDLVFTRVESGVTTSKLTGHEVRQVSEKDGKETVREFVNTTETRSERGGKELTVEVKLVNDGTFAWTEQRDPKGNRIQVTKVKSGEGFSGLWPEPLVELMKGFHERVGLKIVGEDTVDGQKMFVLEGTFKPDPARRHPYKEMKEKAWVGQDDLLVHRRISGTVDQNGNESMETMDYPKLKVNQGMDPEQFKYTPPEGVEVSDETEK